MTKIHGIDTYIQKSLSLFEAEPSRTRVSITYGSNLKKHKSETKTRSKKPLTKNSITFKTFDPRTGVCLKYKTYKLKEFSRLLSLLGPRSIQFNDGNVRSVGSLMSNHEFAEPKVDEDNDINMESSGLDTKETTPQPSSSKSKKKKKGNKKR